MNVDRQKERILLHICCAPCSTHPIQLLSKDYQVVAFFYNPNLYPPSEHHFRLQETQRYCQLNHLQLIAPDYQRKDWLQLTCGARDEPEGGRRCQQCFGVRLEKTAETAHQLKIPNITTTLTIGPNKPASVIFPLGIQAADRYNLNFVALDFKKKDGYKTSVRMSREAGMYRQNYCGCEFSIRDRNIRNSKRLKHQQGLSGKDHSHPGD